MISIGEIGYLNVYPIYYFLKKELKRTGQQDFLKFVYGTPAFLNKCLDTGTVDISPSSSFYYIKNYESLLLLPDISISSKKMVKSIYLFSPLQIEALEGQTVYITPETYTSLYLLKVILAEKYGLNLGKIGFSMLPHNKKFEFNSGFNEMEGKAFLQIGNNALKFKKYMPQNYISYDLADLWYKFTSFPFIFALFIIRKDSYYKKKEEFRVLYKNLIKSKKEALKDFAEAAREALKNKELEFISYDEILDYWMNCLSFDLNEKNISGFILYCELLRKHRMIESIPTLNFIEV